MKDTLLNIPGQTTVYDAIREVAASHPVSPALITPELTLSYGELLDRAHKMESAFPVRKGRIGILMERGPAMIEAMIGVLSAGAEITLADTDSHKEARRLLREAKVRFTVTDRQQIISDVAPDFSIFSQYQEKELALTEKPAYILLEENKEARIYTNAEVIDRARLFASDNGIVTGAEADCSAETGLEDFLILTFNMLLTGGAVRLA